MTVEVLLGDCLAVMAGLPDACAAALVTDPPAGISFMGAEWDHDKGGRAQWVAWLATVMCHARRLLQPGAHALVWALPRTSHWTATALEDAGFEVRDVLTHHFGSGYPKNLNVSQRINGDNAACRCRNDAIIGHEQESKDVSALSVLRGDVSAQEQSSIEQGAVLQSGMLRGVAGNQPRGSSAPAEHSGEWQGDDSTRQGPGGRQEPSVEGGRDAASPPRQLSASAVCAVPARVSTNGPQGRLCDGAPASYGSVDRALLDQDGDGPSSQPHAAAERAQQPGTVARQPNTQAGRVWPLCDRCGLPIIPDGLGTALKPATEHWILCRKPLAEGTVAGQVLATGTGALNIDGCRVEGSKPSVPQPAFGSASGLIYGFQAGEGRNGAMSDNSQGRWPSNLFLTHSAACDDRGCADDCPVAAMDRQSGVLTSGAWNGRRNGTKTSAVYGAFEGRTEQGTQGDSGGASRFFPTFRYEAKASREDRGKGNTHPTVKPLALMQWLCRLVAPPGGVVLDPFAGSGTTAVACIREGRSCIAIERDEHYHAIACRRVAEEQARVPLIPAAVLAEAEGWEQLSLEEAGA